MCYIEFDKKMLSVYQISEVRSQEEFSYSSPEYNIILPFVQQVCAVRSAHVHLTATWWTRQGSHFLQ